MKNLKEQNAITLIALIVTIIVLLILAGISLTLIAGGNGIIGKAEMAVSETQRASIKEEAELALAELQMDYYMECEGSETFASYVKGKCEISELKISSGGKIYLKEDNLYYANDYGSIILREDNGKLVAGEEIGETMRPATITINPENYGDNANYFVTVNGTVLSDWKVFLNDETNIYLIAGNYVPSSTLSLTNDVVAGGGAYCVKGTSRDGLVSWLATSSNWSEFAKGMSDATATGGPTLEQFWASYNKKYGTSYSAEIQDLSSHAGYSDMLYYTRRSGTRGRLLFCFAVLEQS